MTNWEQWVRGRSRKDIICAYVFHDEKCDKNCILYRFCSKDKNYKDHEKIINDINIFLDSEAVMEREAVIINLAAIRKSAEQKGYHGYVQTLDRAIELLKED